MSALIRNKWLSLSLLAIILPISILTTLKFSGLLVQPQPETITLKSANWTIERPSYHTTIGQKFKNEHLTDEIVAEISIHVQQYWEKGLTPPFGGRDGFSFEIGVNTTICQGSGVSLAIKCHITNGNSTVYISNQFLYSHNVSIFEIKQIGSNDSEACLKALILKSPNFIKAQCHWAFNDDDLQNHTLSVSLEVLYFNGVLYRKIVLPLNLSVISNTTVEG